MMSKEQIELVASRYGIPITYVEPGNGGFIIDKTGKIYSSVAGDLEKLFSNSNIKENLINSSYPIDESYLLAA